MSTTLWAKPWEHAAQSLMAACRLPIETLLNKKNQLRDQINNYAVFNTFVNNDKSWEANTKNYYSGIALAGDMLGQVSSIAAVATFAGTFTGIGAGAVILGGLKGFFLNNHAQKVISDRATVKPLSTSFKNKKSPDPSVLEYGSINAGDAIDCMNAAAKSLEILRVGRHVKQAQDFYVYCDGIRDDAERVAYARYHANHIAGFDRILPNLCRHAQEALRSLNKAHEILTIMPPSTLRDSLQTKLINLAFEFEPETRMLPHSDALTDPQSIWSDIQRIAQVVAAMPRKDAAQGPSPAPMLTETAPPPARKTRAKP